MAGERPVRIACGEDVMVGVLHETDAAARVGVVVVVGGPQVRAGSHRQFVLLARHLAAAGFAVLRFDCRGKGDSGGSFEDFDRIDDDVRAAVDHLSAACPSVERIVLWGLCDGASASLFYAYKDARIGGIVFLNPWVRTEDSEARAYLKHYYRGRLTSGAFWRKLLTGRFDLFGSAASLLGYARAALARSGRGAAEAPDAGIDALALPERMGACLELYRGPALLILSGNDMTAREFEDCAAASPRWRGLLERPSLTRRRLDEADHTFSRRDWRDQVAAWTAAWLAEAVSSS